MSIDPAAAEAVLGRIHEDELVELVLTLSNVESPPGFEGPVGDAIHAWLADNAFAPRRVGMFEDRFNVFAEVRGAGRGPALAFNAHMDVSVARDDHLTTRDPSRPEYHIGWAEGDMLIGNPVVNDKGPMSAFMIAAKAIRDAGVKLDGSLYLSMVAGEIGQEPVDEFQGKRYLSKEVGTRYLLNHSPRPQFCVCAEATAFRKGWVEAGKAFYKITIYGGPVLYTPYLRRPYTPEEQPNAILRAVPLLQRLEEWAYEYEQANRYEGAGGTVVPKVNIGAVRSGRPWMILTNPEVFMVYLDIRTAPGQDGGLIRHELRDDARPARPRGGRRAVRQPRRVRGAGRRAAGRRARRGARLGVRQRRRRSRRSPRRACGATTTSTTRPGSPRSPTGRRGSPETARTPWPRRTCSAPRASMR